MLTQCYLDDNLMLIGFFLVKFKASLLTKKFLIT